MKNVYLIIRNVENFNQLTLKKDSLLPNNIGFPTGLQMPLGRSCCRCSSPKCGPELPAGGSQLLHGGQGQQPHLS